MRNVVESQRPKKAASLHSRVQKVPRQSMSIGRLLLRPERASNLSVQLGDHARRQAIGDPKAQYRALDKSWEKVITTVLALMAPLLGVGYIVWLSVSASQRLASGPVEGQAEWQIPLLIVSLVMILVVEILRLSLVFMMSLSTALARQPKPMKVVSGLRAAIFITFVPSSEDLDVLEKTLIGAQNITFPKGMLTVFVLDEGYPYILAKKRSGAVLRPNEQTRYREVPAMIKRLNKRKGHRIIRLSRAGKPQYSQASGSFAAKTKHGNINAALAEIDAHPERYGEFNVVLGLDPDHCPNPSFANGMLGWFADPDVAYVAGPQAYSNAQYNWVARLAESQQFVFHSCIQPAANTYRASMLVGTSYAVRWSVLEDIGGMQSSITEDMATTYKILSSSNPRTGNRWTSVYTNEVLAAGEGPSSWGDFYKQQDRWSRGAMEFLFDGSFIRSVFKMAGGNPLRGLHYLFMMSFYPVTAIAWLLTSINALLYTVGGQQMQIVDPYAWLLLYGWVAIVQITMYAWARRNNVSPFEHSSSWGFYGMFMSIISAPVYAASLIKTVLYKPYGFSVTPKGKMSSGDTWYVFRLNVLWGLYYVLLIIVAVIIGNYSVSTLLWPIFGLTLSVSPIVIWRLSIKYNVRVATKRMSHPVSWHLPRFKRSIYSIFTAPPASSDQSTERVV